MKLAYIGIDLFYTALDALDRLGCEIAEIFTCETDNETEFNVRVIDFAKRHGIPYTLNRITREDFERLAAKGCTAAVCAGYYYKIPVSEEFPIVNIHPSLLPRGRGSWPMPYAILRREKESGVTVHKIAEGFDTGDILLQERFFLSKDENLETFMEKACALVPQMMKKLTDNFGELWETALPQGEGEYLELPTEKDWTVTPDMTAAEADLILRAFYGFECVYKTGEEKITLIRGRAVADAKEKDHRFPLRDGYIIVK